MNIDLRNPFSGHFGNLYSSAGKSDKKITDTLSKELIKYGFGSTLNAKQLTETDYKDLKNDNFLVWNLQKLENPLEYLKQIAEYRPNKVIVIVPNVLSKLNMLIDWNEKDNLCSFTPASLKNLLLKVLPNYNARAYQFNEYLLGIVSCEALPLPTTTFQKKLFNFVKKIPIYMQKASNSIEKAKKDLNEGMKDQQKQLDNLREQIKKY